ncbi:hypothetical protein BVRB_2g025650 [Beta vulgaris subsp. vulgaris]|nr:hypothetical protein BVRB_2g025650 [Beta vulgaris subsp. vulgaris]
MEDGVKEETISIKNPSMEEKEVIEALNSFNQEDLLKALEVVERDSLAIAESYTSLFASLRLALSELLMQQPEGIVLYIHVLG